MYGGCPTFHLTSAWKRDCCWWKQRSSWQACLLSNCLQQSRFKQTRKRCKTCRVREREIYIGSSVRLEFSAIRYGSTPEIVIIINVVVRPILLFIDSSSCHSACRVSVPCTITAFLCWTTLNRYNGELHTSCLSSHVIRVGEVRRPHRLLVGKTAKERPGL